MLTTYGANLYADFLMGTSSAPAQVWLALTDVPPGISTTGSTLAEPTTGGYARVRLDTLTWQSAVDGVTTLLDPVSYTPSANWGTLTYYGLCDASTAGNLIHFDPLPSPIAFPSGRRITIPSGALTLAAVI